LYDVAPDDWSTFLKSRVYDVAKAAPLDGISRGGYSLVYGDEDNAYFSKLEASRKFRSFMYSVGVTLSEDNTISGVQWDSPAFENGLKVSDQIVAINKSTFSADKLKKAILKAENDKAPIQLLVKSGELYRTVSIDYHDGLRIPRLVRNEAMADRLGNILTAK